MQLQQDTLFDNRYLLKRLLGCGGFSEVWLVEDLKVGNKKMALKIFVPDSGLDDDGVQLFSSEFELVFDLNHTNLLRPAHFDVCERSPYLLMPYCEQGSANKLVGRLDEEEAWLFLHDVSAGLAFLHAQNPPIIHQDIKPDNILKDNTGNYQITDFGISTKARSTLRKSMNTAKSGGTMAYMPPERFGKENTPIKASDVWAAGATLYELIAGDIPFGEHGGLRQKSGAEIPNIPGKWSNVLLEIIYRCLQRDPWDRPVAQQIVDWTEKRFRGEKIIFNRKTKKSSSKKILIGTGGCVAALLLAFIIVKTVIPGVNDGNPVQTPINTTVVDENKPAEQFTPETTPLASQPTATTATPSASPESTASNSSQTASDASASQTSPASTTSNVPPASDSPAVTSSAAWVAEYDRILNRAQSAYFNNDYVLAKLEYNKALTLANRNGDSQKATFVNGQISECNKAIETANKAAEDVRQKEMQERLASYNLVGNLPLGSDYWIVQRKSDNRWGIIRKDGSVAEAFNYSQVSSRLKNGYFALKNEQGWVVFDTSLRKVADSLEKLDDYR